MYRFPACRKRIHNPPPRSAAGGIPRTNRAAEVRPVVLEELDAVDFGLEFHEVDARQLACLAGIRIRPPRRTAAYFGPQHMLRPDMVVDSHGKVAIGVLVVPEVASLQQLGVLGHSASGSGRQMRAACLARCSYASMVAETRSWLRHSSLTMARRADHYRLPETKECRVPMNRQCERIGASRCDEQRQVRTSKRKAGQDRIGQRCAAEYGRRATRTRLARPRIMTAVRLLAVMNSTPSPATGSFDITVGGRQAAKSAWHLWTK